MVPISPRPTQVCHGCGGELPPDLHPNDRHCSPPCKKTSRKAAADKWRSANHELANERTATWATRITLTARRHGISAEKYRSLMSRGCWVCKTPGDGGKVLAIDHDHKCCPGVYSCGKCIRGVLCGKCNRAIGALGDTSEGVMRAVHYLRAFEANCPVQLWGEYPLGLVS